MKKLFAIIVAVALMVVLIPLSTTVFAAQDAISITKSFAEETYELCDIVEVTIVVEADTDTDGEGLVVEDIFPAGLTLLDEVHISGGDGEGVIDLETNTLTVTFDDDDTTYTITCYAEVTYARADVPVEITNTATVYDGGWDYENREYGLESEEAMLTVEPYTDFVKELADGEWDYQYSRTPHTYDMVVNIENTIYSDWWERGINMQDVMVMDNLPGNIVYESWVVEEGSAVNTKDNDGKKNPIAHLVWDLDGNVNYNDDVGSVLTVSTDSVGGKDKDKHNLKNHGSYTLNPGATLIFTDHWTGNTCMVDSAAVKVDVVQAAPIS